MEMKNNDVENVDYRSRPHMQTLDNIAQSLPLGQLGKCHADELLPASKMSDSRLRIVGLYQAVEGWAMHKIENLSQDEAAGIQMRHIGFATQAPSFIIFPEVHQSVNRTPV